LDTLASQHCNNTLFKMGIQNLRCYNDAEKMLIEMDASKGQMEKIRLEAKEILKENIIAHIVVFFAEKSVQEKAQVQVMTGIFQALKKSVQKENTT
jgi:hypothetical protein